MIHEHIFVPVRDAVKAKGMPFEFIYGPPQLDPNVGGTRIFIATDDDAGDAILPARSQRMNPQLVAVRAIGVRIVILAHSTVAGARRHNHEELALQVANMIHVAIEHQVAKKKTLWRPLKTGFVSDASTDGWAGRVYVMRLQIDTPVSDLTWVGDDKPTGTFVNPTTSTQVTGPVASTESLPTATTRVI